MPEIKCPDCKVEVKCIIAESPGYHCLNCKKFWSEAEMQDLKKTIKVKEIVRDQLSVKDNYVITEKSTLREDLGADDLDMIELVMWLEEEFDIDDINDDAIEEIQTVQDIINLVKGG